MIRDSEGIFDENLIGRMFRATVVENQDPKKWGRIKIDIEFYNHVPISDRPWVYRILPVFPHAVGAHSVPRVGEEVLVVFPDGTLYHPHYIGVIGRSGYIIEEDYPRTSGLSCEDWKWTINPVKKFMELHNPSKNMIIKIDENSSEILIQNQTSLIKVRPEQVIIQSPSVLVDAPTIRLKGIVNMGP